MFESPHKNEAIRLRKGGLTYSEILRKVPVAKSTLSLWLREVKLARQQVQRITEKKLSSAKKGAEARRAKRIQLTKEIYESAKKDIQVISDREFWLLGVMLYWAEGSKEKEWRPGSGVQFTNSDPRMIALFIKWLTKIAKVSKEEITFELFIHRNHAQRIPEVVQFWSSCTHFPADSFQHIYFKKHNPTTKRKNVGKNYYGTIKIRIRRSSRLNRKIAGWTQAVIQCVR